ncbi:MAG: PTS sugar transporter subunit IIA, partial [Candidatus Omnitrophica bacterium]|nr:PTS sugar transporter subunit IIA [Candidatus Omnitrophota bacterium]MBU1895023.1 PTS sugar transporter subunit IIA [Candidatus Omnitrophota bacterium]
MFYITDYIREDLIIANLRAKNRNDAIMELIDKLYRVNPSAAGSVKKEEAFNRVIERENSQSTGVGDCLAVPHARIEGWGACTVVIAASSEGINFDSIDQKPVSLVALIISSENEPYLILQIMAALIRAIKDSKILKVLKRGIKAREIYNSFKSQNSTKLILARDIMRPVKIFAKMNDNV